MSIQDDKNAIRENYIQLMGYTHVFNMVKMNGTILHEIPKPSLDAQWHEEYDAHSAQTMQTMTVQVEASFGQTLSQDRAEALAYSYRKTHLQVFLDKYGKLHKNLIGMESEDDDTLYDYIVHDLPLEEVRMSQAVSSLTLIEFMKQAQANGFTETEAHKTALVFLNPPEIF